MRVAEGVQPDADGEAHHDGENRPKHTDRNGANGGDATPLGSGGPFIMKLSHGWEGDG